MHSLPHKLLALCFASCSLVGCSTASKTTEYVNTPSTDVALAVGDVEPGARIALPTGSGLGVGSVVADRIYTAASGHQCRRLRTVEGMLLQRVACKRVDGVWSLARDLRPDSSITPLSPDAGVIINADEQIQSLVPSAGTLMLQNQESTLPVTTLLQPSTETVVVGAIESPIHIEAQPLAANLDGIELHSATAPLDTGLREPVLQAANESVDTNTNAALLETVAERVIISREAYSAQIGAVPLENRTPVRSMQNSSASAFNRAAEPEIETVTRTVNANETLWSFAKRTTGNALNWERIARINGITDAKTLASGSQLFVPVELVGQGG